MLVCSYFTHIYCLLDFNTDDVVVLLIQNTISIFRSQIFFFQCLGIKKFDFNKEYIIFFQCLSIKKFDFKIFYSFCRCMDPLTNGYYPHSMRFLVEDRLPKFTKEQSKLVKGSFDFIGLNYYTAYYATYAPQPTCDRASYTTDSAANLTGKYNVLPTLAAMLMSFLCI